MPLIYPGKKAWPAERYRLEVQILVTFHYSLLLGTLLASIRYSVFVTLLVTELFLLQRYSGTLQHANCYCTTAVSSND